jgi:ribosomal protein S18 acetylase RimI-like enzyme
VARDGGQAVGFLAALATQSEGRRIAVIDLVGVAPAHQRRRIGRALTIAFIEHYRGSAAALQVGTQVANTASVRLYERLGFSLLHSQYVLHLHVQSGTAST